jgi:hypothetical protein
MRRSSYPDQKNNAAPYAIDDPIIRTVRTMASTCWRFMYSR